MSKTNSWYTYVKQMEDSLNCAICKEPFKTPVMINLCSHNFCSLCIRKYFLLKLECPVCGIDASQTNLFPNRALESLLHQFIELRGCLKKFNKEESFGSNVNFKLEDGQNKNPFHNITPNNKFNLSTSNISIQSNQSESEKETPEFKLSMLVESQSQGFSPTLDENLHVTELGIPTDSRDMFCTNDLDTNIDQSNVVGDKNTKILNDKTLQNNEGEQNNNMAEDKVDTEINLNIQDDQNHLTILSDAADCPVCGLKVTTTRMNIHLDMCLNREEKKNCLRANPKRKKTFDTPSITKLVYKLYSIKDLRNKMKDIGLNTTGNKQELSKRHKDFLAKYQAEQDKIKPRELSILLAEFEKEENVKTRLNQRETPMTKTNIHDPENKVERLRYLRKYSKQYEKLEAQVKCDLKLKEKADKEDKESISSNDVDSLMICPDSENSIGDLLEIQKTDSNYFLTPLVTMDKSKKECQSDSPEFIFLGVSPTELEQSSSNKLKRKIEEDG